MLKGITFSPLLCLALGFVSATSAQLTQPHTIKDYYVLLPKKYFEVNQEQRIKWMLDPRRHAIVDSKNDYLYAPGDGAQTDICVRLFKRPDGTHLIGVKTHARDTDDLTYLDFYVFKDGQWEDVTRQVLPIRINEEFRYEMPRYDTTIKATNRQGKRLYDLIWMSGVFKLKKY